MPASAAPARPFHVELIKPSHYDDDGYVIQWRVAFIPSSSLGAIHAMVQDVAARGNFCTIDEDGLITDRRAGRIREGTRELCNALQDILPGAGFSAALRPATGYRAVMRLSGPGPLPEISDTDPGSRYEPCDILISHSLDTGNSLGEAAANALNLIIRQAH